MIKRRLQSSIFALMCLLSSPSFLANESLANEKITVAFGEKLAPWVLSDTNEGIIVDIITETMVPLGYEIEHIYLPYARRTKVYAQGEIDVVTDVNLNTIKGHNLVGYLSDTAYSYENFAISLRKNNFNFSQISDLTNYSVLSWQDAATHLGKEYAEMVENNPTYSETFDQLVQVKMLFLGKVEVIQMDANIFDYYRLKIGTSQQVDRFALFGPSPNGFLFKSKKMRDQFNLQFKKLKASGKYQQILDRYTL